MDTDRRRPTVSRAVLEPLTVARYGSYHLHLHEDCPAVARAVRRDGQIRSRQAEPEEIRQHLCGWCRRTGEAQLKRRLVAALIDDRLVNQILDCMRPLAHPSWLEV